ncbi:Acetate kinase [hydrothermal vent metagenome]|uniref:Acetate kinase n=1 Tax=hydrothermal vent metagenome TaxID=652676 RepID=A0A1W1ELR2_9ZZZZ
MKIIIINVGSSSIKFKIFDNIDELYSGLIENIDSFEDAFDDMKNQIIDSKIKNIDRVGHRVVHGGDIFYNSTIITPKVLSQIESLSDLAPLHNPLNLIGIRLALKIYPNIPHFAIFDTAFHTTIPDYAYRYAIDNRYYIDDKIRKYGFHGISASYITREVSKLLDNKSPNIISIHLGNGASITAIRDGKSIDTSMGFTPLDGLIMGSRSGDLDPMIVTYIMKKYNLTINEIENILNKESGLKGLSGLQDMRDILDDDRVESKLAVDIFCYRIKKYIGAYIAIIGGVDMIIFTGGIGENSALIRDKILDGLEHIIKDIDIKVIKANEELEMVLDIISKK